jgi:hypothetical protein
MIDITTLPKKVQTELRNDPFIFIAANQKEINIKHLSAIVLNNDVMHVVDVLPRHNFKSGFHPFYLQHTSLFKEGQNLFKELFGHEPDKLIYTYKGDFTTSIFLFTSSVLIEKALKKEEIEITWNENHTQNNFSDLLKKEERKGVEVKNVAVNNSSITVKLPLGVFPVIGALNSIDSGWRTPNFNLIFGTEYLLQLDETSLKNDKVELIQIIDEKKEETEWLSNIDEYLLGRFKYGISLYSIDKFDFKLDNELCDAYDPFSMDYFYSNLVPRAKTSFIKTIVSFLLAINRGTYLPLNGEQFSSFIPHFYGYDRLAESVAEYDEREKRKLKRLYDTAFRFSSSCSPLTCKNFIDYFLRDSIINFESLRIDPAKEILKAFKDQPQIPLLIGARKEILSRFIDKGRPTARYDQFLNGADGQVDGKNKIYPML